MILVDANILIYSHVETCPQHQMSREWLDQQLNGSARVGLPWSSVLAFLRLVTNPRVFERPEAMADAWGQVRAWLACETTWIPQPTERHIDVLDVRLHVDACSHQTTYYSALSKVIATGSKLERKVSIVALFC